MIILLITLLFTFLSYYFASFDYEDLKWKILSISCFIASSFALRLVLQTNLNNDYLLYYNFQIFHKPYGFLSYLLNEPYLYLVYTLFSYFIDAKETVFQCMYWFNYLIATSFFVWLLIKKDVEMWKKMVLFVCHYFLFAYVVLRNGPSYILFAMYFYYSSRNKKFNWILITPFMHISSCLLLVTYIHKWKYYFFVLFFLFLFIFTFFLLMTPFLLNIGYFNSILSKIATYSQEIKMIKIMHIIYFLFIILLSSMGGVIYKRKMLHPILLTPLLFYVIAFYINPILAHRFSPYVLFSFLLFPFNSVITDQKLKKVNQLTILFFPIFVYTLFNTHTPKLFFQYFMK
ncbi:hypothetical protein PMI10_00322 [Flavobacterium sp. CF136]|nr:hypothetical protein PMI10_00322 [Flavobacterium sp. CF136]